jgi:hypothetical protein
VQRLFAGSAEELVQNLMEDRVMKVLNSATRRTVVNRVMVTAAAAVLALTSGLVYAGGAKRDPFMDLRVREPRVSDVHDPHAFLVEEIALRGLVKATGGWTAMVLGPDRRTYFVSAGQRFYDGTLVAVDAAGVTIQQQVRDPLAPPRSREVRLTLHPETN